MIQNNVLSKDVLETKDLDFIKEKAIDTVVCNENRVKELPKSIQVVNAELFRIEGTWEAYEVNNAIIEQLWQLNKSKFSIRSIDIRPAASKWLYWTNYRIGALEACIKNQFSGANIVRKSTFKVTSKLKEIIKYFKIFIENNIKAIRSKKTHTIVSVQGNPRIAILVNNDFEIILYRYIFDYLKNEDIIIFHYGNIDFEHDYINRKNIQLIDLSRISCFAPQAFIFPFTLDKSALGMANILLQNWQSLGSEIARYECIKNTGIQKILINVGENLPLRNLMKPVFGDQIQVINTMNGLKSGEAHDADINFDQWLVWDQEMKDLLVKNCHINPDTLIVAGHLSEDHIRHHQFENTINLNLDYVKDKKIITIFSVRGNRKEKVDVFNLIYQMLKDHPDWYIIVKPHPLEKKSDYIWPEVKNPNVIYVDEQLKNSKSALYDLLHISDLSLVFGSTVALESSWVKTPCITFEYRSVSFIHTVNNEFISHVNTIDSLKDRLINLKKCERLKVSQDSNSVSYTIASLLKN